MAAFIPDRAQKIRVIRDLVYEYGNLMAAAQFALKNIPPWQTNCCDAFLLGCRKVGDFLLATERRKTRKGQELDDVLALDYLPPDTRRMWDLPIWTAKWRDDMNKYLTHITYRRAENREAKRLPHWDHTVWVPRLRGEFNKAWWDFREAVTDGEDCAEFDRQFRECEVKSGFETVNLKRQ
jgi:hypothetical protein